MSAGVLAATAIASIAGGAETVAASCVDPPEAPPAALATLEAEQAGLFAKVAPSVVLLIRGGVTGAGFAMGAPGLVLTSAHVVGEADEVSVQTHDGRFGRGRVVARSPGALDLAVVRTPFDDLPALAAGAADELRAGTWAATVGHGGGAAWTFSTGLIANPRPLGDGVPMILAQVALRPGSSGGPLVDRLGRAVGVVTAGTRDASGVTFAIRIDAAAAAFPQLAAPPRPAEPPLGPPAEPPAAVAASPAPPADAREARPPEVAPLSSSAAAPTARAPAPAEPRMARVRKAPRGARAVGSRSDGAWTPAPVSSHGPPALPEQVAPRPQAGRHGVAGLDPAALAATGLLALAATLAVVRRRPRPGPTGQAR